MVTRADIANAHPSFALDIHLDITRHTKLVANGWHLGAAHTHLGKSEAVPIRRHGAAIYLVDISRLVVLQDDTGVLVVDHRPSLVGHALAHDDIAALHKGVDGHEAILLDLVIVERLELLGVGQIRLAKHLFLTCRKVLIVLLLVRDIASRCKHAAVHRILVQHDRVLLVVASPRHDGNRDVHATWQLIIVDQLADAGLHNRLLRIVQDVTQCVVTLVKVGCVAADRLLAHGRIVHGESVASDEAMVFTCHCNIRNHTVGHLHNRLDRGKHELGCADGSNGIVIDANTRLAGDEIAHLHPTVSCISISISISIALDKELVVSRGSDLASRLGRHLVDELVSLAHKLGHNRRDGHIMSLGAERDNAVSHLDVLDGQPRAVGHEHRLLEPKALVAVTGRLVVVAKRNGSGQDAKHE